MTLLKNTLHLPRFGYNLIENYFIDTTISRYFLKNLVLKGLEMSTLSIFFGSESQRKKYFNFAKMLRLFQMIILLHKIIYFSNKFYVPTSKQLF